MSKSTKTDKHVPEVNIGLVGHVDHGKTTLTYRLTGKWTDQHSEELKRGITIRVGYANASIYKCNGKYQTSPDCDGKKAEYVRTVSFVDAPGHESLMATMLAGATIMDGALLLVSANEPCPQPQTKEHLTALKIMGIEHVIVVQNKIDLVTEEDALENFKQIKDFLKGSPYEDAPIIPISAKNGVNIDVLLDAIEKYIPTPERDEKSDSMMVVARSFDVNKPGSDPRKLIGGVFGGAVKSGIFKEGDEIEIRPGFRKVKQNKVVYDPIKTRIVGIHSGDIPLSEAKPGGSVAFSTELDPSTVHSDQMAGSVIGYPGKLPPVHNSLVLELHLLDKVVGLNESVDVGTIKQNEMLMLNVNAAATVGIVSKIVKRDVVQCVLRLPVCASIGSQVAISRRIGQRFRLIGYGVIMDPANFKNLD